LGLGCNYHRAYKRQASQLKDNRASHEDAGQPAGLDLFVDVYAWSLFFFCISFEKVFF
jgi:hypothetical protein